MKRRTTVISIEDRLPLHRELCAQSPYPLRPLQVHPLVHLHPVAPLAPWRPSSKEPSLAGPAQTGRPHHWIQDRTLPLQSPPFVPLINPSIDVASEIPVLRTCIGSVRSQRKYVLAKRDVTLIANSASIFPQRSRLADIVRSPLQLPMMNKAHFARHRFRW